MGADLLTIGGEECRIRLIRSPAQSPFSAHDKPICQSILHHFMRAVHLRSKLDLLDVERQIFAGTVECMRVGTATLDEKGAMLSSNDEARANLDERDGIRIVSGALQAGCSQENAQLQRFTAASLRVAWLPRRP